MSLFVQIIGGFLFFGAISIFFASAFSIPLYKTIREETFLHMIMVLLLFGTTILLLSLLSIFTPTAASEMFETLEVMKLSEMGKIISVFMLITMTEFTFLYLHLSSNRNVFFEHYIPLIPTLVLGMLITSLIISNEILETFLFFGLYGIAFLVDILVIIMLIRLRHVKLKFAEQKYTSQLLTHLITMLLGYLIYQFGDLVGFIGIVLGLDIILFSIALQVFILPFFGILLVRQSHSILKIVDKINYPLLFNELN
ncbi:MAG: hypothetical protein EAX86_11100 [Candidatus Heimdallarchaeota archaeon]|nr:hypothetical protein [Candidatus Heimdallarchaeota archaeon]